MAFAQILRKLRRLSGRTNNFSKAGSLHRRRLGHEKLEDRSMLSGVSNGLIAFYSQRDGNPEIYVMNPDGSGQTRLTNNPADDFLPAWSPDGSKIAFVSNRDGNFEIYVMNADGSNQTRLTFNTAVSDVWPSWSPDGARIAFHSGSAGGDDANAEIYIMNADGSNQTRLTNNTAKDVAPDWSPDGSKIAFQSDRDGNVEIYVMNADGTNQVRLTNNFAPDGGANWSPDGSKIVFSSERDGLPEIYVMNADGGGQTNLTNHPANDAQPAWSPDGTQIVFRSQRDGFGEPASEIYVMNADGSGQTRLTINGAFDGEPDWQAVLPPGASAELVDGVLTVQGTVSDDAILVSRHGNTIEVQHDGEVLGTFDKRDVHKILVDASSGNDLVWIDGDVQQDAILLGGGGNDLLRGGKGRTLLIGGEGVDVLSGNSDSDILIGGTTVYDADHEALCEISDAWGVNRPYRERVNSLRSRLNSATVLDDGSADFLFGAGSLDWFFSKPGDILLGRHPGEFVN